jgi:hypothetical protein
MHSFDIRILLLVVMQEWAHVSGMPCRLQRTSIAVADLTAPPGDMSTCECQDVAYTARVIASYAAWQGNCFPTR